MSRAILFAAVLALASGRALGAPVINSIAGSEPHGSATGWGIAPVDAVTDAAGNTYVSVPSENRVLRISASGTITTYAGCLNCGSLNDGGPATNAALNNPQGLALDAAGNLYIADTYNSRIRRVAAATGIITTIAGNGSSAISGDGGPATSAAIGRPLALAVNGAGTLVYFTETNGNVVRRFTVGATITTVAGGNMLPPAGMPALNWGLNGLSGAVADASGNAYFSVDGDRVVLRLSAGGTLSVVAGTGQAGSTGDGGPGTSATLQSPQGLALDSTGGLLIADAVANKVRRVDLGTGIITTVAGNGASSYAGDGGPATAAALYQPYDVAADPAGGFYIADRSNNRIRFVNGAGDISTVAGTGATCTGLCGDGGPATAAPLGYPFAIAFANGRLFIADYNICRIRKVEAGTISTVAGVTAGCNFLSTDNVSATAAYVYNPIAVEADASGNFYYSDYYYRVRRVNATTGIVSTIAGSNVGNAGYNGDGANPTTRWLYYPNALALEASGTLLIADRYNYRLRRWSPAPTPTIATVAGGANCCFGGDGYPAAQARLYGAQQVALDGSGNLYIADANNQRIRRVDAATLVMTTVAGTGTAGFSGDGGPATSAALAAPRGVAVDAGGNLLVSDVGNSRIRRVDAATQVITTVAGTGATGFSGDGGPATAARLTNPGSARSTPAGTLVISDNGNYRVRHVDGSGIITTLGGNGWPAFSGDGGAAADAQINVAAGVVTDAAGNVYFSDQSNHRVRRIDAATGIVTTVAGSGTAGFSGDGGPATSARLYQPGALALDGAGNLYISDTQNYRVRKVSGGTISTVAGNGCSSSGGDNVPATSACVYPNDIDVDTAGNLYVADYYNNRVRKVSGGIITTVAGTGNYGYNGDNIPATSAWLYYPYGIAVDVAGNLYIADYYNYRVRKVSAATGLISTIAGGSYCSYSDNVPATSAYLCYPRDVEVDAAGNVFVTSSAYNRIQRIDATTGYLNTVAGNGSYGLAGDGGPALSAWLAYPPQISATGSSLYLADGANDRIRKVTGLDVTGPVITPTITGTLGTNGWYRSNTTLSWSVTDPDSAIQTSTGCGGVTVAADTVGVSYTCQASSNGGSTSVTVTIKRDATAPVVTLASRLPAPNGYGWNNSDVTLTFAGTDTTSGIATCTAPVVFTAEAGSQWTSATCTDNAGNTSAPLSVTGVNVDKTAPTASASASPPANGAGWNNAPVTVSFSGSDALSGIASCTSPIVLSGEGTSQSASGTCTDRAGNESAPATLAGVSIDLTRPTATATATPGPNGHGWNDGPVTVSFAGNDAGSGIVACSPAITLVAEGAGLSASGTCTDVAGNVSDTATASGINIDHTGPVVTATATPAAGASGWNTGPVTVAFSATDALSGVALGDCDPSVVLAGDGAGQSASGGCTDRAGNRGTATRPGISIDQTPPTAVASALPLPNAAGWNNTEVTVTFAGTDALPGSGLAGCTASAVLSGEGAGQGASGSCADVAGNVSAPASVTGINIDRTPPNTTATASPLANAHGWRNADVTVSFTGSDSLSGLASCSPDEVLSTEGAGQSASGTCRDLADNVATATASGVSIDKTAPTVTAASLPSANAHGWNNTDVTVSFSGSDALSGLDASSCTPDSLLSAEGAGQTASGSCTDRAGNTGSTTSAAVSIDKTPPVATAINSPGPNGYGWNNGDVTVRFGGTDLLSGIDASSCTGDVLLTAEGTGLVATGGCSDRAGNASASVTSAPVSIDRTPPLVSGTASPAPNAYGWNNTAVTATFSGSDSGSGIPVGGCDPPVVLSGDGAGQSASATCADRAGNIASASVVGIDIDRTPPTATATATPAPNANGWNNTNVTVSFAGTDSMSGAGVLSCSGDQSYTSEGVAQAAGTCTDRAGNDSSTASRTVRIDKTAPTVSITTPANGGSYNAGSTVNASYACSDGVSGVGSCTGPVANGSPIATSTLGSAGFTVTGADQAGNQATRTNTYTVVAAYTFIGFLSPVDNLPVINTATAGRTIPVKWQLKDGAGNYVSSLSSFVSMLQQPIACDAAPEDIVEEQLTSPGSTLLRYDTASNQFIYNWQTTKGWSGCRLLQLTLADGTKQYAKFRFK